MNRQIKTDNNEPMRGAVWIIAVLFKGAAWAVEGRPATNVVRHCTATNVVW